MHVYGASGTHSRTSVTARTTISLWCCRIGTCAIATNNDNNSSCSSRAVTVPLPGLRAALPMSPAAHQAVQQLRAWIGKAEGLWRAAKQCENLDWKVPLQALKTGAGPFSCTTWARMLMPLHAHFVSILSDGAGACLLTCVLHLSDMLRCVICRLYAVWRTRKKCKCCTTVRSIRLQRL